VSIFSLTTVSLTINNVEIYVVCEQKFMRMLTHYFTYTKLHIKLQELHISPNFIGVIKSRRIRRVGYVGSMGNMTNL